MFCSSLTSVTIPDSVTAIGERAFVRCSSLQGFKGKFASEDSRCLIVDGVLNSFAPAGLTEYTIPNSVTTIGEKAFIYCSLESVTIPDSVTTIGNYAFGECHSLTSVTIGDSVTTIGVYAFSGCSSLTSVYCKATTPPSLGGTNLFSANGSGCKIYVPTESVEAYKSKWGWSDYASDIVGYDFENGVAVTPKPANNEIWYTNGSTTEATTPNYSDVFGANIVSNTYDAAKECWVIKFDGEVTMIGKDAFESCSSLTSVSIPDSVTTIGDYAFCSYTSLTSVTIGDSVTTIGYGAFEDCSSLTSVTIPDSVTAIGEAAFANCSSLQEFKSKFVSEDGRCLIVDGTLNSFAPAGLTEYTIPDSVTTIGEGAFWKCYSLTSVTIPDSVTMIGYCAFDGCTSLTSVTIPDSVTTIGESAFCGCSNLTSVIIPDRVTTIGMGAFYWCNSLTSVTIPDSVTSIGDRAFGYCYNLTSVTIGNSVTTIGNRAFYRCEILTSVTIPDSVTSIGNEAFAYCYNLTSVYCKAITPPALGGTNVFDYNNSGRKIYVPTESVNAYKSASRWSGYASAIVGYNF